MVSLIDIELLFHCHDDDAQQSNSIFPFSSLLYFSFLMFLDSVFSYSFCSSRRRRDSLENIYEAKSKQEIYLQDFSVRWRDPFIDAIYFFPTSVDVDFHPALNTFFMPSSSLCLSQKERTSGSPRNSPGLVKDKKTKEKYEIHKNSHFQESVWVYSRQKG